MLGPEVWSPEAQWYVLGYVKFTRDINTKAQTGCPTAAGGCGRPREAAGGCGRLREAGCKQCHWRWGRGLQIGLRAGRGTLGAAAPVAVASWRRWPALGAAAPAICLALGAAAAAKGWRLMERGARAPTRSSAEGRKPPFSTFFSRSMSRSICSYDPKKLKGMNTNMISTW